MQLADFRNLCIAFDRARRMLQLLRAGLGQLQALVAGGPHRALWRVNLGETGAAIRMDGGDR